MTGYRHRVGDVLAGGEGERDEVLDSEDGDEAGLYGDALDAACQRVVTGG